MSLPQLRQAPGPQPVVTQIVKRFSSEYGPATATHLEEVNGRWKSVLILSENHCAITLAYRDDYFSIEKARVISKMEVLYARSPIDIVVGCVDALEGELYAAASPETCVSSELYDKILKIAYRWAGW